MEEIFDIYTRDGKYLWTASKADCHSENPGFYHKPVWIRIINSKNEILVQKRAACKKNHPNKRCMWASWHVHAGETIVEWAMREVYEELGIKTKESDYKFICEYIVDETREIAQIYLLKLDLDINEFKLQKDEVAEVKWLNYDEFKNLFNSEDFVEHSNEYREFTLNILKDNFTK